MKVLKLLIFTTYTLTYTSNAQTGRDIMKKVYDQARIHKTQKASCFMEIKNKSGETRERHFRYTVKYKDGSKASLIKFYKPNSVKGTGLLSKSIENKDNDENSQWLYLPAFKSLKRLSSSDKNASFMGSDFSYLDIAGRNLNQDNHSLKSDEKNKYAIESIPKDKKDNYSKIIFNIDKKTLIPININFYQNNKKLKTLTTKKVKKIKGVYMVTKNTMANHKTNGQTTIEMQNIEVGMNVNDNQVGIKGLKEN